MNKVLEVAVRLGLLLALGLKEIRGDSAWFQVCDTKQKYALNSKDCSMGLWLKHPITVSCVCVNGVWVVSSDVCDKQTAIIVGQGDCFTLQRKIRSVKLLGDPNNPFKSKSYIATENLDSFVEIPQSGYTQHLDSPAAMIISIFPNQTLRRADHEVCLDLNSRFIHKPVHLWKNPRRVSNRFRYVKKGVCDSVQRYDTHIGFGEVYQDSEVKFGDSVIENCASKCLSTPKDKKPVSKHKGRSATKDLPTAIESNPNASPTRIKWDGLYNSNKQLEFTGGSALNEKQKEIRKSVYRQRWNNTLSALAFRRETREQSVRMVQAHTNFVLLGQPTPVINTPEYDYFQKMRQVYLGSSTRDLIPEDIINALMRMFRQLLWESHDKFEHREHPDILQYGRIMERLDACLLDTYTTPVVFTTKVVPVDDAANQGKQKDAANSTHDCFDETIEVWWNKTEQPSLPTVAFMHASPFWYTLPENDPGNAEGFVYSELPNAWDVTKYDYVVELAWKIYQFGYYRCASYFEKVMNDLHQMAFQIQSLFNPQVVKRWHNPEGFNKVLEVMFPNFNYSFVANITDLLVKGVSEATTWGRLEFRPPMPMSDMDLPHIDDMKGNARRKRAAQKKKQVKPTGFWSNRANCMQKFSDPIKMFKYDGKSDCHIPDPEI